MEYTKLGRSNMSVSKICLGTMHFGPKATEEESHQILDRALEMGVNFIDTANVYGGEAGRGRSEEIIGNWFAARPGLRDEIVLATKVYNPMGDLGIANDERGSLHIRFASTWPTPCVGCRPITSTSIRASHR